MQLRNFSLVGLIGALVFLAGTHLLWKNRHAAIAWLREFVCILRGELAGNGGARKNGVRRKSPQGLRGAPRPGALVLVGAVALILIGQILFFLDLAR